jgi:predicted RNA-binding Zn-ribbon protein involved in translation (DUF1610 family)
MILKGIYYSRPTEQYLAVERAAVAEHCPECGGDDVRRYPAFTSRGPKFVVKCQRCLALVAQEEPNIEEAHPPFWPLTRQWDCTRAG